MKAKLKSPLKHLRPGDRREFARLVDAYSGPLYRLALKMLGNPPDAEDALQNTFLKAFQHLDEFEGRSSLSTWLYRIASNEALMLLRKRRPEITFTDVTPEDEDEPKLTIRSNSPTGAVCRRKNYSQPKHAQPWTAPSSIFRIPCESFLSCAISKIFPFRRPARRSV